VQNPYLTALAYLNHATIARVLACEFKLTHYHISAVLDELGLPWIPGYRPKANYQNAIIDAIDRYLTKHPSNKFVPQPKNLKEAASANQDQLFVDPPPRKIEPTMYPRLQRLVRKFDPAERDCRNRTLGMAGEEFVLEVEHRRLVEADRKDLARKIRWISKDEGDGAGYDIHSFNAAGKEQLLEVKTTNGSARTPFFLSRNECNLALERPSEWRIYRVHKFATGPQIFVITPPLERMLHLAAQSWRASF